MCVCVLLVFRVCEVRRRYQVPSNQSSREVWATMWGLATEEQQGLSTARLFLQLPARAIWRLWREIIQISKVSGPCRRRHLGTWLEQVLVSIFEKNPVELVPGIASYEKKIASIFEKLRVVTMDHNGNSGGRNLLPCGTMSLSGPLMRWKFDRCCSVQENIKTDSKKSIRVEGSQKGGAINSSHVLERSLRSRTNICN